MPGIPNMESLKQPIGGISDENRHFSLYTSIHERKPEGKELGYLNRPLGRKISRFRKTLFKIFVISFLEKCQIFANIFFFKKNFQAVKGLISSLVIIAITIARTFMGGYSMDTDFTVYFRYEINAPSILLNSLLVYSCLFTVLFSNIREPMLFFTGFRNYLKKASKVGYNTATVNYRIKKDSMSWNFIQRYYAEYKNYDGNIVLTAMTTHFLDLGILEIEGSNAMLESSKTERS